LASRRSMLDHAWGILGCGMPTAFEWAWGEGKSKRSDVSCVCMKTWPRKAVCMPHEWKVRLVILDPLKAKSAGWERGAGASAISAGDDGGDVAGVQASAADLDECACDDADHVPKEAGAGDFDSDAVGWVVE